MWEVSNSILPEVEGASQRWNNAAIKRLWSVFKPGCTVELPYLSLAIRFQLTTLRIGDSIALKRNEMVYMTCAHRFSFRLTQFTGSTSPALAALLRLTY